MPWKDPAKKREYMRRYNARPEVIARNKDRSAEWQANNAGHRQAKEAERRLTRRAQCLVGTIRTRARKRGLEFDLDDHLDEIQAVIDAGVCQLTGFPFGIYAGTGRAFDAPSIDRKDPARGYTFDNIRVVVYIANLAMSDFGEDALRTVMNHWLNGGHHG